MASHLAESTGSVSWYALPAEVRTMILQYVVQDKHNFQLAAVSSEWQSFLEWRHFQRIKLTPSRLKDFHANIRRNRRLLRYIWFCVELGAYSFDPWVVQPGEDISNVVSKAIWNLFSTLSKLEPEGELVLDISVYSPSDAASYFKYLTFGPDHPPYACNEVAWKDKIMEGYEVDKTHRWVLGRRMGNELTISSGGTRHYYPKENFVLEAMSALFNKIDCPPGFDYVKSDATLPSVRAVTTLQLRQQTRKQFNPNLVAILLKRLPGLQEFVCEPWGRWGYFGPDVFEYRSLVTAYTTLVESFARNGLKKIVLFENFSEQLPLIHNTKSNWLYVYMDKYPPFPTPSPQLSQILAKTISHNEHLSASYGADAWYFFNSIKPAWRFANLKSLALTCLLLQPDEKTERIYLLMTKGAALARLMPKLEVMELWYGRRGVAALFRYEVVGQQKVLTWRATWNLALSLDVIQVWADLSSSSPAQDRPKLVNESVNPEVIGSHGDAIHHLKLRNEVLRPISLNQIRAEDEVRERVNPRQ